MPEEANVLVLEELCVGSVQSDAGKKQYGRKEDVEANVRFPSFAVGMVMMSVGMSFAMIAAARCHDFELFLLLISVGKDTASCLQPGCNVNL